MSKPLPDPKLRSTFNVHVTGWTRGLDVSSGGSGIVSHAGLVLLRSLADKTGLTAGLSKVLATPRLLIHAAASHPEARTAVSKAIARVLRADLAVVDDIGLLPVAQDAAEGLYHLVDAAYEKRSVAVN